MGMPRPIFLSPPTVEAGLAAPVTMSTELTPAQIVTELDRYIVGQGKAKRAVAIALRNRWRRQSLPTELRDEVAPKNIIMIGPTGVGKTEVARRLAKLSQAPFIKVEASKYTEVGYVGRDVESMIRELTELGVNMVKSEVMAGVQEKAEQLAEDRLLDILLPGISGLEVLRYAKKRYPGARIIMVTGQDRVELRAEARLYGACAYVTKPFDFSEATWSSVLTS